MADIGSLEHIHCPTCDHCIESHNLIRDSTVDELVLVCLGCHLSAHYCPARNGTESRQNTLRLMYIHTMREFIKETGI